MFCPFWSIFQEKFSHCIKQRCGMYHLCNPDKGVTDKCPNCSGRLEEITSAESAKREFICIECNERFTLPFDY